MDRLQAMQVFVEIVRRGSLTAAAAALDRSPPTVVRVLAGLEDELRVRLLHRTTRRLSLTDEGRIYLELCRRVLGEIEEGERALTDRQVVPSGLVSVTAPVRFGEMHVAPLVTRFVAAHPRVEARLLLLDRPLDLLEEGVDVAVRIGRPRDSSLIVRPVGEVRQVVVASPALLRRQRRPTHPSALAAAPCVRFLGITGDPIWSFGSGARAVQVPVTARLVCNHAAAMVDACVAGLGFGRALSYQVMPDVLAGRLRIVLADFEPPPLPVSVLYPPNRAPSARVRALVDWLAAGLKAVLTAVAVLPLVWVAACGPASRPADSPAATVVSIAPPSEAAPASAGARSPQAPGASRRDRTISYKECLTAPSAEDRVAARGLFKAGIVAFQENDFPRAIEHWKEAFERDCTASLMLLNLGKAYEKDGQWSAAIASLETYLQRNPQSSEAPSIVGRIEELKAQRARARSPGGAALP